MNRSASNQAGSKPAVLLVGPYPPPRDGMSAQLARWAEGLAAEGHRVVVMDTRPGQRHRPVRRWLSFIVRLLAALPGVRWVNVHSGSDVYFFAFTSPAILLGRLLGKTVLVTYKGGRAEPFFRQYPFAARILRLAHVVFVPSPYLKGVLHERAGIDPIVMPNILVMDVPSDAVPHEPDQPLVLVTRNFDTMYDIPTALGAFAVIQKTHPHACLSLFGDGPLRGRLEEWVEEHGLRNVSFHGNRPPEELAHAYARASLFLNPSTVDNTPNSIVEALAFGVPVVSTDVGGIPDLTEHGKAADLVPAGDPEEMARKALQLLADPRRRDEFRKAGLVIAARFSWSPVYHLFQGGAGGTDSSQ